MDKINISFIHYDNIACSDIEYDVILFGNIINIFQLI